MRTWVFSVLAAAGLSALGAGHGQTAPQGAGQRVEIPIKEVDLTNGDRRYTIPIKVGGTQIEAGLDSGSSGLRILPNVLAAGDAEETHGRSDYSYGSGAALHGLVGKATLSIGDLAAPTTVQLIRSVGCTPRLPNCPARKIPLEQYGIQGDGLPGQGFKAIIGVNMAEAEVASPLRAIGAKRWIIELPRPGENKPGRLILNPTDDEVKTYVRLPVINTYFSQKGGMHDSVAGCLVDAGTRVKACGDVSLDTGAPGLEITTSTATANQWPANTKAELALYDGSNQLAAVAQFQIGLREHASRMTIVSNQGGLSPRIQIHSGIMPYFAFSVLYDPAAAELGFQARPGGPHGLVGAVRQPDGSLATR